MAVTKESLDELSKLISCKLEKYLVIPGGILYSSHDTICAGDVYLIGMNPGGTGGSVTLDQCRVGNMTRTDNELLDADWDYGVGQHPIQKRARWLLEKLGLEPRKVFTTNLVFMQSNQVKTFKEKTGLDIKDIIKECWSVHEAFLSIVRPSLILAFGNNEIPYKSPYSYMRKIYNGKEPSPKIFAGYSNWRLKGFKATIAGRENVFVAGLPHLSYYDPFESGKSDDNQPVINWIKSHWTPENKQA